MDGKLGLVIGQRAKRLPAAPPARINWLFLPALLVTAGLTLPLAYLLVRGLDASPAAWNWLLRVQTLEIIARSLGLALAVTLSAAALALPLAWLVSRTNLPGRRLWAALLPLPLVIPSYVGAYLFVSVFSPRGLLQNTLAGWFNVERLPSIYGFWGALIVLTLMTYPYIYLAVRAVLLRNDRSVEEAARSLGCSPWQTFWRVNFPRMLPALASAGLLVSLYVLRDFGAVSILRYTTFTRAIYLQYQSSFDRSAAALLALVLVGMTVLLLVGEARLNRQPRAAVSQSLRPAPPAHLGGWRYPALFFVILVLVLALLLPAGVLLYWLMRGLAAGEQLASLTRPLFNSLGASALAVAATVLAALPAAILAARKPGWLSRLVERWSYLGFALPGIVAALALVFFGANYIPGLYQTLAMLVFAYLILYLPQAVGSIQASLRLVHRNLEEAAYSLGSRPLGVFRRVTLPLVAPGIASAAALIFLTVMKELPATLILAPTGFRTLATQIWSAVSEAYFARAAAPALMLILLSSLSLAFLNSTSHNLQGNKETG